MNLYSMSSHPVDVLLLQPFTTYYIISRSSTGERKILFVFLEVKYSYADALGGVLC